MPRRERCILIPPGFLAAGNFFLDNGPGFSCQERLFETLKHLTKHCIEHRKGQFVCLDKFSC